MSQCPSSEDLAGFVAGTLPTSQQKEVADHVASCKQCLAWIERNRDNADWVDRIFQVARPGMFDTQPDDEPLDLNDGDSSQSNDLTPCGNACQKDLNPPNSNVDQRPLQQVDDEGRSVIDGLLAQGVLRASDDPEYIAELDTYKILGYAGRGGMGIVLKAFEEKLGRVVAVKVLRADLAGDSVSVERFSREAKAAAALNHPNIVTVHAVGQCHGTHYIAMEFVDGPTLNDLIRKQGPLDTDSTKSILRQILLGLEAAHEAGLIHRDVKSSNILLGDAGRTVKIADFGLALMASVQTRLTMGESTLGTPEYMSPEQTHGDRSIDHRTDLYSVGVILYEMLTGQTPFKAISPSVVIHRIQHEQPQTPISFRAEANEHLSSLSMRLMAKRPEDRFATSADVIEALESDGPVQLLDRRRRVRHRIMASLIILLAIAGLGWMITGIAHREDSHTITAVRNGTPDEKLEKAILARYGDDTTWREYFRFPNQIQKVAPDPQLVHGEDNEQLVIAGTTPGLDDHCLFAINEKRELAWQIAFESPVTWPDCGSLETAFLKCEHVCTAVLAPRRAEEILALANDYQNYPSAIFVVDPKTGSVRSRFWHFGRLAGIRVLTDFLGPGHPAVVVWGVNNKLDGFGDPPSRPYVPLSDESDALTEHRRVAILAVLDPQHMNGLGPPRTARVKIEEAMPVAYAYLDLPNALSTNPFNGDTPSMPVQQSEAAAIINVRLAEESSITGASGNLVVGLNRAMESVARAALVLDRNLNCIKATPTESEIHLLTEQEWISAWHPIIQNGQYVVHSTPTARSKEQNPSAK